MLRNKPCVELAQPRASKPYRQHRLQRHAWCFHPLQLAWRGRDEQAIDYLADGGSRRSRQRLRAILVHWRLGKLGWFELDEQRRFGHERLDRKWRHARQVVEVASPHARQRYEQQFLRRLIEQHVGQRRRRWILQRHVGRRHVGRHFGRIIKWHGQRRRPLGRHVRRRYLGSIRRHGPLSGAAEPSWQRPSRRWQALATYPPQACLSDPAISASRGGLMTSGGCR